jgi:hypothetical protein
VRATDRTARFSNLGEMVNIGSSVSKLCDHSAIAAKRRSPGSNLQPAGAEKVVRHPHGVSYLLLTVEEIVHPFHDFCWKLLIDQADFLAVSP